MPWATTGEASPPGGGCVSASTRRVRVQGGTPRPFLVRGVPTGVAQEKELLVVLHIL
jgi:hypothetical protein